MSRLSEALWLAWVATLVGLAPSCYLSTTQDDDVGASEVELRAAGTGMLAHLLRRSVNRAGVRPLADAPAVRPELVELGQLLAFDKVLSGNGDISCLTCHHPTLGTDDDRALPIGTGGAGLGVARSHPDAARIPRNAPALFNLHVFDTMFWDSRVEPGSTGIRTPADGALTADMRNAFEFGVVSAQSMFPVTSRDEMRGALGQSELGDIADDELGDMWAALMARLRAIPAYVTLFEEAYPEQPFEQQTFAHAANAIAGFEVIAFEANQSPFERFLRGKPRAMGWKALAGGVLFFRAGCGNCHTGSALSDFEHHNTGLAQFGPGKGDGPSGRDDFGRERVTAMATDRFAFRTPSLHNVELTAPYGRLGQYATLAAFVRHYVNPKQALQNYDLAREVDDDALADSQLDTVDAVLERLDPVLHRSRLRAWQVPYIVAFLQSLTDPGSADLSDWVPDSVPSGLPVAD